MAETTADVRRDIEMTRNRISDTLSELENKMNVTQLVKENPWPALALAIGAGVLLSGSRADIKAAAATTVATKGASSRLGSVLDDLVSQVVAGFHGVVEQRIEGLANEVKRAIGAPTGNNTRSSSSMGGASMGGASMGGAGTNAGMDSGIPRAD
jgi:Tfp pilus assembly protein FimV